MELNFSEIKKEQPIKQKSKFTYDDILNSLNMVVNDRGELQYMAPKQPQATNGNTYLKNNFNQNKLVSNKFATDKLATDKLATDKLEPELKNSAIYNKLFKNYKEIKEPSQIKLLTPQEYKQQMILNKIKALKEKQRIAQIKPTKLIFVNGNNSIQPNVYPQTNLNKLFKGVNS
jgi:type IV secretory pathway VirB6-like protein